MGNVDTAQPEAQPEYVTWEGRSFRGSNTGYATWLISLKQRRFVKVRGYFGCNSKYSALLNPLGRYLQVSWRYWNKRDPPHIISIELITYRKENERWKQVVLKRVEFSFTNPDELKEHPAYELVKKAYARQPSYHAPPIVEPTPVPLPENVEDLFKPFAQIEE